MRTFVVIHVCDKMPDTLSGFMDVVIVVEMNFFLLESADKSFRIPVLPRTPSLRYRNLNAMPSECREISL